MKGKRMQMNLVYILLWYHSCEDKNYICRLIHLFFSFVCRHYGALQGYNKDDAYKELNIDQERVMEMRRSFGVRPPRMDDDHPYWHGHDRR